MQLAGCQVDLVRQVVSFADGSAGTLTTREAQLLAYLAARPEQDVSREELLDRVWSYRASYATRAVDVTMRRLRAKVEPDPQTPVHLISVHGVGYRFVPTPSAPASRADRPFGGHTIPPVGAEADGLDLSQVPSERTRFVGRDDELERLQRLLRPGGEAPRLVSVLGPGGVGKSRLASHLVHRDDTADAQWPGGVWWCELQTADGLGALVATVAAALSVVLAGTEHDMVETVGRALSGRGRALVVLDGFERCVGHAARTVGEWIGSAPEAVFLVTSRERLRLSGERVIDVSPLGAAEGRTLLVDRMAAAGVDVEGIDEAAVDRVVRRLEGLPLAIELAAPRARLMSLDALHARLDERFKVLRTNARDDGRTLRAVLDGSWDLLEDDERRALTWCSTFVGGFTLEAAEAVLDQGGDTWPLDRIEALRDKSLLRVLETEDDAPPRLGLYDSVREYAAERLAERGEVELAEARHAAYLADVGEELASGIERHGGRERMVELAAEADNLLAVVRRRVRAAPLEAVRAALALEPLFTARGPYAVYAGLLDEVLAAAVDSADIDAERLAALRVARANLYRLAGRLDCSATQLEAALALVGGAGSVAETRAYVIGSLLAFESSRVDDAVARAEQGLAIARQHRHRWLEGTLAGMLGAFATVRNQVEEAERRFAEAIRLDEEAGNEPRAALDQSNFALLLTELGRLDEAEGHLLLALEHHLAWRNTRGAANAHSNLAMLRARQGRLGEAQGHAREAVRMYKGAGYTRFAVMADQNVALLQWARRGAAVALPHLREVAAAFEALDDAGTLRLSRAYLAAAEASEGHADEAERVLGDGGDVGKNPRIEGVVEMAHAFVAMARGHRDEAVAARDRGLASALYQVRFLADLLGRALDGED
ncbi:MAG: winged helix-turn-helix domain-containing protein [Bryobacterales bacterium]